MDWKSRLLLRTRSAVLYELEVAASAVEYLWLSLAPKGMD